MYTKHAELKAGIVVLIALAALLGFLFRAGDSEFPWSARREVWLRFEQGFAAPQTDDPAYMNGVRVGRVARVWQAEEVRTGAQLTLKDRARLKLLPDQDGTAREVYVLASVVMKPQQKVPRGTTGEISVSLTGSRTLAFLPGLLPGELTDEDTRAHPIPTSAAGDLAGVQRAVEDLIDKVAVVVGNADLVMSDVRGLIAAAQRKVEGIDLEGIQGNVLEASKSLREGLETARARIDEISAKVSEAATNVRTLTADGSVLVKDAGADVREVLAHLKELSATLKDAVARLAPRAEEVLAEVATAVRTANASLAEFSGLGTRVQAIVGETGADLHRILARVSETGHNLADMTEDLRSHPWKLANRPEDKEIAFENVRNAATNYVRAAQAIQESLTDLKTLDGRGDLVPEERRRLVGALTTRLQADLARYEQAAKIFSTLLQSSAVQAPR